MNEATRSRVGVSISVIVIVGLLLGLLRQIVYGSALIAPLVVETVDIPPWSVASVALLGTALGCAALPRILPRMSRKARAVGATALAPIPTVAVASLENRWLILIALLLAGFLAGADALAMSVIVDSIGGDPAHRVERVSVLWIWQSLMLFVAGLAAEWVADSHGWRAFYWCQAGVLVLAAVALARFCPDVAEERQSLEPITRWALVLIVTIGLTSGYTMNVYDTFLPLGADDRGVEGVGWTGGTFLVGAFVGWLACRRRNGRRWLAPDSLVLAASVTMLAAFTVSLVGTRFVGDGTGFLLLEGGFARLGVEISSTLHSMLLGGLYAAAAPGVVGFGKPAGALLSGLAGAWLWSVGGELARYDAVRWWGLVAAAIQLLATIAWFRLQRPGTASLVRTLLTAPARLWRRLSDDGRAAMLVLPSTAVLLAGAWLQLRYAREAHSSALWGDTGHNFTDVVDAVPVVAVGLLGSLWAGHRERIRAIATLVIAGLMIVTAALVLWRPIAQLLGAREASEIVEDAVVTGALVGLVANLVAAAIRMLGARLTGSEPLRAAGEHALWDALTSVLVLVSATLDPWVDTVMSVFIAWLIWRAARRISAPALEYFRPRERPQAPTTGATWIVAVLLGLRRIVEDVPVVLRTVMEHDRFGAGALAQMPLFTWFSQLVGYFVMPFVPVAVVPRLCLTAGGLLIGLGFARSVPIAIAVAAAVFMLLFIPDLQRAAVTDAHRERRQGEELSRVIVMREAACSAVGVTAFAAAVRFLGWEWALAAVGCLAIVLTIPSWWLSHNVDRRAERPDPRAWRHALRDRELRLVQRANVLGTKQATVVAFYLGVPTYLVVSGGIDSQLPLWLRGPEGGAAVYLVVAGIVNLALAFGPLPRWLTRWFDQWSRPQLAAYGPDLLVAAALLVYTGAALISGWAAVPLVLAATILLLVGRFENNSATQARVSRPGRGDAKARQAVEGICRLLAVPIAAAVVPLVLKEWLRPAIVVIALVTIVVQAAVALPARIALRSCEVASGRLEIAAEIDDGADGRVVIVEVDETTWHAPADAVRQQVHAVLGGRITRVFLAVGSHRSDHVGDAEELVIDQSLLDRLGDSAAVMRAGDSLSATIAVSASSWEVARDLGLQHARAAAAAAPQLDVVLAGRWLAI